MQVRDIPNAITVVRLLCALPLTYLLWQSRWQAALALVLLAGFSDWLDGYLAKRFDWRSEWGGMLDPLADKLLLNVCALGLWWNGPLPTWLLITWLSRDLVIICGAAVWHRLHHRFLADPSALGKATTFFQVLYLGVMLGSLAFAWPLSAWLRPLAWGVSLLIVCSGLDYVVRFGIKAHRLSKERA